MMNEIRKKVDIILSHLWTQTEVLVGMISGCIWTILNFCLGGIDTPIRALAVLMCLDFITGITAGWKGMELSSKRGSKGLFKKMGVLVCITVAYMLDLTLGMDMFRGMAISAFAIIEAMSLIENIDRMGYGYVIPEFLRVRLAQIAEEKRVKTKKGEDKVD